MRGELVSRLLQISHSLYRDRVYEEKSITFIIYAERVYKKYPRGEKYYAARRRRAFENGWLVGTARNNLLMVEGY